MAILPNLPAGEPPNLSPAELAQLFSRLKQSVLHPSPERERRLRNSEFERTRVEAVRLNEYVATVCVADESL